MKFQVIEFEKMNKNGRTYLKHEITHLPEYVPCVMNHDSSPSLNGDETLGMAKMTMDESGIYAEVTPYSHKKEIFENIIVESTIVSAGYGRLSMEGFMLDYRLDFIFLTQEPA